MRILMISHLVPYPPRGGVMIRNFNLLKEMAKNHEIYLFAFNQKAHFRDSVELEQSIAVLRQYCKHLQVFEIPTDRSRLSWYLLLFFSLFSRRPYSTWRFYSRKMVRAIKEHIERNSFDIIEIGTIALANFAKLALYLPKVLVHHNIESQLLYRRSRYVSGLLSKAYMAFQAKKLKRLERQASELVDYHITCSAEDRATLQDICPMAKIMIVPNGVDIEYFQPGDVSIRKNSLIFVGGLNWFPNRDAMIYFKNEIWPLLKEEIPDVNISVVGMEPSAELLRFSKQDNGFRLLGLVDDVRPCMAEAAVYVVPIRVGGGTRLKILDAMAMGKAIVSSSVGCEGIRVDDAKDIIIADDPQEFASRVIELLRSTEKRIKLGENARKKAVEKYSWSKITPLLEEIYAKAAAQKNIS